MRIAKCTLSITQFLSTAVSESIREGSVGEFSQMIDPNRWNRLPLMLRGSDDHAGIAGKGAKLDQVHNKFVLLHAVSSRASVA